MKKNIILVGIMGSGKTSIGLSASYKLKMPVLDMDKEIEKNEGMAIKDIFEKYGEDYFRNAETQMAKKMSELSGYIISTGGGIVLREENMSYLKKTGVVVYIHRTPDEIARSIKTENRPLLADGPEKLYKIYNDRKDLYVKYSDIVVANNGDFKSGVEALCNAIQLHSSKK